MKKTLAILFVCAFLVGCAMPSNNWVYPDTIIKDTKDYDGVRFIERDKPKIDTIIPKKLTIDKSFTPNSNIYWSPQLKIWTRYLLTPGDYKVYLALNVNGKDKTQEFDFKIIDNNK